MLSLPLVAGFVAQPPLARHAVRRAVAPILCAEPTPEEVTKKWGFEAGLFSALKDGSKDKGESDGGGMVKAGDLLKRYGGAYLLTSTSLALVSFTLCYVLVDNGVDVNGAWLNPAPRCHHHTPHIHSCCRATPWQLYWRRSAYKSAQPPRRSAPLGLRTSLIRQRRRFASRRRSRSRRSWRSGSSARVRMSSTKPLLSERWCCLAAPATRGPIAERHRARARGGPAMRAGHAASVVVSSLQCGEGCGVWRAVRGS